MEAIVSASIRPTFQTAQSCILFDFISVFVVND